MRKFLLSLCLSCTLLSPAIGGNLSKTQISAFIIECQRYEGVEVVQLGRLATGALKATIRMAGAGDPDVREMLKLIGGIKRIAVLEYGDCEPAIQARITRKLDRMLSEEDLLMETKDGYDRMHIYGVVDDRNGTVNDFVLHTPSSSSLICIFGSIPIEKLAKIVADHD